MSGLLRRLGLEIDGFVGRLFHYAANEPWRSAHPELRAERWPASRTPAAPPPSEPPVSEPPVSEPPVSEPPHDEETVLRALTALGGSATLKEISAETGNPPGWLRPRLKNLTDRGAVRRVGEKLRTRYERV